MLYEDDVVDAVADYLESEGWTIEQRLRSTAKGDDIVATQDGRRLIIEAKGETSSVTSSSRFGVGFSGGQVRSHVGQAVLRALRVVSDGDLAGVAFPDEVHHRREVARIRAALVTLDVAVFWVDATRRVSTDPEGSFSTREK